jgi:hypothetical protein
LNSGFVFGGFNLPTVVMPVLQYLGSPGWLKVQALI